MGVRLSDVPPLPNAPLLPCPQHEMSPLTRTAQVWVALLEIPTALYPKLLTKIGLELELRLFPLPRYKLSPQHDTEPLSNIAHVCESPAEITIAVLPTPRLLVNTGEGWQKRYHHYPIDPYFQRPNTQSNRYRE